MFGNWCRQERALEPYRNSGCLWVEDKTENVILGTEMGLESVLMKHRFNEVSIPSTARPVNNWRDIYEYIKYGGV